MRQVCEHFKPPSASGNGVRNGGKTMSTSLSVHQTWRKAGWRRIKGHWNGCDLYLTQAFYAGVQ